MSGAYSELPTVSPGFVGAYGKSDMLERSDLDPLPLEQTWRSDTNPLQLEHEGLSTPRGEVPLELAMHEYEHTIHLAWPSARVEAVTLTTIGLTCEAMAVLPFSAGCRGQHARQCTSTSSGGAPNATGTPTW